MPSNVGGEGVFDVPFKGHDSNVQISLGTSSFMNAVAFVLLVGVRVTSTSVVIPRPQRTRGTKISGSVTRLVP